MFKERSGFEIERPSNGGTQRLYKFPNGYGASVIKTPYSYGGQTGLWELAVLHNGGIYYSTDITDDVLGGLTVREVEEFIDQIEALPVKG